MMCEGLRRLQALGAAEAYVGVGTGEAANRLYESVGFTDAIRDFHWQKTFRQKRWPNQLSPGTRSFNNEDTSNRAKNCDKISQQKDPEQRENAPRDRLRQQLSPISTCLSHLWSPLCPVFEFALFMTTLQAETLPG
jgi:hypothetical protein